MNVSKMSQHLTNRRFFCSRFVSVMSGALIGMCTIFKGAFGAKANNPLFLVSDDSKPIDKLLAFHANMIRGKSIKDVSIIWRNGVVISMGFLFTDSDILRVDPMNDPPDNKWLWVQLEPNDPSS